MNLRVLFKTCVALLLLAGAFVAYLFVALPPAVRASYGEWGLVDLILLYSRDHDGKPPESWDNLTPYFQRTADLSAFQSLDDLKQYVTIDFDAIQLLAKNKYPGENPSVIGRKWGIILMRWTDPNWVLRRYYVDGILIGHCVQEHDGVFVNAYDVQASEQTIAPESRE